MACKQYQSRARKMSTLVKVAAIVFAVPLTVWTYKCAMLVALQRFLIYLPYLPLNARSRFDSPQPHRISTQDIHLRQPLQNKLWQWPWLKKVNPVLHGWHVRCTDITLDDSNNGIYDKDKTNKEETKVDSASLRPILLYFQGNGGNISHRLPKFRVLLDACPNMDIIAISYRGYGLSDGKPSEHGLIADGVDMIRYALQLSHKTDSNNQHDMTRHSTVNLQRDIANVRPVWLYGHSLGGAVAIHALLSYLQQSRPTVIHQPTLMPQAIVLENTFTSIADMLRHIYPRYTPYHYLSPLLRHRWDSARALPELVSFIEGMHTYQPESAIHLAWIIGESDEMVPSFMMHHLHTIAQKSVATQSIMPTLASPVNNTEIPSLTSLSVRLHWLPVPKGLHNLTWQKPAYRIAMTSLYKQLYPNGRIK